MEVRTVTTLRRKRQDITRVIALYERQLARARDDLVHVEAAIAIFDASGDPKRLAAHVDVYRLYRPGELIALCKSALKDGPTTTQEMIARIMRAKGMDPRDAVLAKNLERRLVNALGQQRRRGTIVQGKRRGTARVWQLRG